MIEFFNTTQTFYHIVPLGLRIAFKGLCLLAGISSAIFMIKFYKADITFGSKLSHMLVMQFACMSWLFLVLFLSFLWFFLPYITIIIATAPMLVHTFVLVFLFGNRIIKELLENGGYG